MSVPLLVPHVRSLLKTETSFDHMGSNKKGFQLEILVNNHQDVIRLQIHVYVAYSAAINYSVYRLVCLLLHGRVQTN